jgi:predicted HTH transcriptional regulator
MTAEDLALLITRGHELRGVEFKPAAARAEKYVFATIVRAALGMANTRDGGTILVGVDEQPDGAITATGLNAAQVATWDYDSVAGAIASFSDPAFRIDLDITAYNDKRFVALRVHEFDDVPILCSKDHRFDARPGLLLRQGACYVRRIGKPETSEIPTQTEMRALLDLAMEKRLKTYVRQAIAAGLLAPGPVTAVAERISDVARYKAESGEPW